MPMAVIAAASRPAQQPRGPVMRAPYQAGRQTAAQQEAPTPAEVQRRFSQVLAGLNLLSDAITGRAGGGGDALSGASTAAPLLLTAPDGSTRAVHWKDDEPASNVAADAEKMQLVAQVQQLQV